MVTPVTITTGLGGVIGSDYIQSLNQIVFVEFSGKISAIDLTPRHYHVLGSGYSQPEDIAVSKDGRHAYVTERSGDLVRVDLLNADRIHATVVSAGMTAPHQLALDEAHNQAYLVEFANPGHLYRIDLTSGAKTPVVGTLQSAIGLALTDDLKFAYVTEQLASGHGKLSRIDLTTGISTPLYTSTTAPLFFLTWADPGGTALYVTERDPANRVWRVDLAISPPSVLQIAGGVPARPSSTVVTSPSTLLLCSDSVVSQLDLTGFAATGPILLGIGFVPVDHITAGFATTDPGYFFQVKDSPFGGTLPLMINHDAAYAPPYNARYYKVFVDGAQPLQSFSDYLWNGTNFVLQTTHPALGGFYPVRSPGQLWYNHWLGYMLDTSGISNGLHVLDVELYTSGGIQIPIPPGVIHSVQVQVDNGWPIAQIGQIMHDGSPVGTCAIVKSGTDGFTFQVTAFDSAQHLLSWNLAAMWGDDKSGPIASDQYNPGHVSPSRLWPGISGVFVPPPGPSPWHATVPGDPTSTHCAHTFYLTVWDRTIDGYNYLHRSDYHKSITIDLP